MPAKRRERWSPEGSYQRSEETRSRILQAGIEVFGEHGFAGGSTRQIVAISETNMASLRYYFGSKEDLYFACAQFVVERYAMRIQPYPAPPAPGETRESIVERLCDYLDLHMDLLADTSEGSVKSALFVAREQANPTPGPVSDLIYHALIEPAVTACARLMASLLDLPSDEPTILARSFALLGQVAFFRINLAGTLRLFGWEVLDKTNLDLLRRAIRQQVQDLFAIRHLSSG